MKAFFGRHGPQYILALCFGKNKNRLVVGPIQEYFSLLVTLKGDSTRSVASKDSTHNLEGSSHNIVQILAVPCTPILCLFHPLALPHRPHSHHLIAHLCATCTVPSACLVALLLLFFFFFLVGFSYRLTRKSCQFCVAFEFLSNLGFKYSWRSSTLFELSQSEYNGGNLLRRSGGSYLSSDAVELPAYPMTSTVGRVKSAQWDNKKTIMTASIRLAKAQRGSSVGTLPMVCLAKQRRELPYPE